MKIHILSDLHLEFAPHQVDRYAVQSADVVVLAGDIFTGNQGIAWARQSFPSNHLIYVAGNHEFYGHQWDALLDQLREEARVHSVDFLENESVTIDGIRFLGATLWTDFDYFGRGKRHASMLAAEAAMNDFRRIKAKTIQPREVARILGTSDGKLGYIRWTKKLTAVHTLERHQTSMAWLKEELPKGDSEKTVVVSHHFPHKNSCDLAYSNDPTTSIYGSHLDQEVLLGAKLWIHGHTHCSSNYRIGDSKRAVRVIANPRGYPFAWLENEYENKSFDPALLVEVDA